MSRTAQRWIMDAPLDESKFSGGSKHYDDLVSKYSSEVGRRYRAIVSSSSRDSAGGENAGFGEEISSTSDAKRLNSALKEVRDILGGSFESRYRRRVTFTPMQEWEGFVTYCDDSIFTAKMCDVKDGNGVPTDEVEFQLNELPPEDRSRIELGAIVRWAIGLERHPDDRRQRVSRVHLRRLPVFTKADLKRAESEADFLLDILAQ